MRTQLISGTETVTGTIIGGNDGTIEFVTGLDGNRTSCVVSSTGMSTPKNVIVNGALTLDTPFGFYDGSTSQKSSEISNQTIPSTGISLAIPSWAKNITIVMEAVVGAGAHTMNCTMIPSGTITSIRSVLATTSAVTSSNASIILSVSNASTSKSNYIINLKLINSATNHWLLTSTTDEYVLTTSITKTNALNSLGSGAVLNTITLAPSASTISAGTYSVRIEG